MENEKLDYTKYRKLFEENWLERGERESERAVARSEHGILFFSKVGKA